MNESRFNDLKAISTSDRGTIILSEMWKRNATPTRVTSCHVFTMAIIRRGKASGNIF